VRRLNLLDLKVTIQLVPIQPHFLHYILPLSTLKMSGKGKEKEKPFASLLAGATAGGVESFITYPFESLKTQLQFGALNGDKVCPLLYRESGADESQRAHIRC
jgi:hypothetical protein